MSRFFTSDPEIIFDKVLCPFCHLPSGKTNCDTLASREQVTSVRNESGVPLPIFSASCPFKSSNLWKGKINYPVSEPLLNSLKKVKGVELINAISRYSFQFIVGRLFDEAKVKQALVSSFKNFIKEMQSKELDLTEAEEDSAPELLGIILPNGQKFIMNPPSEQQTAICNKVLDAIEGSKPIIRESDIRNLP